MTTHPYATNSPVHPRLTALLVFLAIGISVVIGWISTWFNNAWGFSVGGISAMTIFGLLYFIFDNWLWKVDLLRRILLVPNLNGRWFVKGKTIKREGQDITTDWDGEINIIQSWTKLSIILQTEQSTSRSKAASLYRYPGEGYRMIYHYNNDPKIDISELTSHSGLCDLIFNDELRKAEGSYFTGKDRMTVGTIILTRKDNHP